MPVLYSWLWSIQLSYGIDSSNKMILRLALDRRTISRQWPLLDSVLGNRYVILVVRQVPTNLHLIREGLTGYGSMFDHFLRAGVYSAPHGWNSWFRFHIILYKSDQLLQLCLKEYLQFPRAVLQELRTCSIVFGFSLHRGQVK